MGLGLLFNTLNAELNSICHLLALLGVHHILHISRIKLNTFSAYYFILPFLLEFHVLIVLGMSSCIISAFCRNLINYFIYNAYRVFPGGKAAKMWCLHPFLAPRLREGWSYTSTYHLCLRRLAMGVTFTFTFIYQSILNNLRPHSRVGKSHISFVTVNGAFKLVDSAVLVESTNLNAVVAINIRDRPAGHFVRDIWHLSHSYTFRTSLEMSSKFLCKHNNYINYNRQHK